MDIERVRLKIMNHWEQGWTRSTSLPTCKKRAEELHPSSFPYCPLRHAVGMVNSGPESETFNMGASMEYYCGIGTVAHLIFQKHMRLLLSETGVFVGDWTCPTCGAENSFVPYHTCSECGSTAITGEVGKLSGDEILVKMGSRIVGHTDDVYLVDGEYYVIDYKTSSVAAIERATKFGKGLPYVSNVTQIKSYAGLLSRKYGIEIKGWFLIYASRDTPMRHYTIIGGSVSSEEVAAIGKRLDLSDKAFHNIRKHLAAPINEKRIILNDDSEKIEKLADWVCKRKLCHSAEYYDREIHDKYDPCPLASSGICHGSPGSDSRYLQRAIVDYNAMILDEE